MSVVAAGRQPCNNILVPGYLLVKSGTDSGTYQLQQTVMAIKVDDSGVGESRLLMPGQAQLDKNGQEVNETPASQPQETISIVGHSSGPETAVIDNAEARIVDAAILAGSQQLDGPSGSERRLPPSRLARVNCPVCSKEFKKTYLKEHMKIHDEEKPYKCLVCGKRYRWRTLLRNHKKTHLANNPFTCPVCGLRMSSKFSVDQHLIKVHGNVEKRFECQTCAKKYATVHQLRAHEKFHAADRTRQCEFCGKIYKHLASLERHRRLHRGEENSADLRLKCADCGLICHSKTHYTAHQRIHTGEKPFVCETCGKRYRQVAQLNQHRIVHTDLRPFSCHLCERTFRCRSNLQLHLDHHRGEKRHACSHCGQKFFSYPNMLKHVRRNHLNLRPHQCQLCPKSFCEKQELQNHVRTHTGEKRPPPKRKRLPLPTPAQTNSDQNTS